MKKKFSLVIYTTLQDLFAFLHWTDQMQECNFFSADVTLLIGIEDFSSIAIVNNNSSHMQTIIMWRLSSNLK